MTTLAERVPPDFWPVIDKIDEGLEQIGSPMGIRDVLEKIAIFNPDAVRTVLPEWGTDGADGLAKSFRTTLEDRVSFVHTKVDERWKGEAWEQFSGDMTHVQTLIEEIGEPARMTGDQLKEFLETIETNWLEIIGIVLEVAGVVLGVVGVITAAAGGLLLAVAGLIIGIVGLILSGIDSIGSRVASYEETIQRLREQLSRLKPFNRGGQFPTPPSGDWDKKTADPNN